MNDLLNSLSIKRITFNEITKEAVTKSLENLESSIKI